MNISQILNTIFKILLTVETDAQALEAGVLTKVGQVGSVGGKPVYAYLSTNASAT